MPTARAGHVCYLRPSTHAISTALKLDVVVRGSIADAAILLVAIGDGARPPDAASPPEVPRPPLSADPLSADALPASVGDAASLAPSTTPAALSASGGALGSTPESSRSKSSSASDALPVFPSASIAALCDAIAGVT